MTENGYSIKIFIFCIHFLFKISKEVPVKRVNGKILKCLGAAMKALYFYT